MRDASSINSTMSKLSKPFGSFDKLRRILLSAPVVKNKETLKTTLLRLLFARVMVLTVLLGLTSWQVFQNASSRHELKVILWLIALTYALSLINAASLKFNKALTGFGYFQLFVDVCLVTLVVHVSGSIVAVSLYLVAIFGAALVFGRHGAVIIASCSGLLYGLLASNLFVSGSFDKFGNNPTDIFGVYVSLVAAALLSSYFAEKVERITNVAEKTATELAILDRRQRQVFNDITEGVITVDLNLAITSINQAASAIMGLANAPLDKVLGTKLNNLFSETDNITALELLQNGTLLGSSGEMLIHSGDSDSDRSIQYQSREVPDSVGHLTGHMLVLRDVSAIRNMQEQLQVHEQVTKLVSSSSSLSPTVHNQSKNRIITGESKVMERVMGLVDKVAVSDASILLTGESGTGKELIAQTIYERGPRSHKAFVAINCGAIPENLIESELFGHKKGSFTGAVSDNPGLFRKAQGGTLFLDEIGELPLHLQTKLLRVLQERKIRSVGDTIDHNVDVRIIAATNKDLKVEIAEGRFREDLFYRINVVQIVLPPLRERREDIPHLVGHFIGKLCGQDQVIPKVSPEALQMLVSHRFPGNIRELENIIERALVLNSHAILPEHLPEEVRRISSQSILTKPLAKINVAPVSTASSNETEILELPMDIEQHLSTIEKKYLLMALSESNGVKKKAAELLGLNFRSFRYRLKKYDLENDDNPEQQ